MDTLVGGFLGNLDFGVKATLGLWKVSSRDRARDFAPQFQVANCGGSSAERSNLDYCNNLNTNDENRKLVDINSNNTTTQNANINANMIGVPPNGTSAASGDNARNATSLRSPSADNPLVQDNLTFLAQCDGVSVPCAIISIDRPATLSDSPTPGSLPFDYPPTPFATPGSPVSSPPGVPPPSPVVSVDDRGLDSDLSPIFTPPPVASVPEASTWVMTIVGYVF